MVFDGRGFNFKVETYAIGRVNDFVYMYLIEDSEVLLQKHGSQIRSVEMFGLFAHSARSLRASGRPPSTDMMIHPTSQCMTLLCPNVSHVSGMQDELDLNLVVQPRDMSSYCMLRMNAVVLYTSSGT